MHAPKRRNQRLDLEAAREIRRLRKEEGMSLPEIAKRFGVPKPTVGQILRGETWREPTAFPKRVPSAPISPGQIAEIKRLANMGPPTLSKDRIGFLTGVSYKTVLKVLRKDQYPHPHTKVRTDEGRYV